jgi:hypothetical protein
VLPNGAADELAQRTKLFDLLEPAGTWIALHVIAENLTVEANRRLPRGIKRRQRRIGCAQEAEALRAILTAQLAGYEMNRMLDQPAVALGFSDQAIEDAHRASEVLPDYHRPHYIAATVHDHRGACYEILQRGDRFAPNEIILDAYRKRAALDELERAGVTAMTADQHYNAACLYCAAADVSATLGGTREDYVRLALTELAEALLERPDYTRHAVADPELAMGPAAPCVVNLIRAARSQDFAEPDSSDREAAVAALVDTAFSDA